MHLPERIFLAHAFLLVLSGCDHTQEPEYTLNETQSTLTMVKEWVHGNYNNITQAEANAKADLPPEHMHHPMHQLFAPVDTPKLEGYILFQQASMDGSTSLAMIFRHGLIQYIPDTDSEALRQRELYFKDAEPYKNAHMASEILADITLDDLTWNAGCDFYLTSNEDGSMVSGLIIEGACVLFNQGLQKDTYADDLEEITASEYRFRGRYVDETGQILWGTESDTLNQLVRQD